MRHMTRALAAMLLCAAVGVASAQSFVYVDAARPDDSGDGLTSATAKRTIQAAVDLALNRYIAVAPGRYEPFTTVNGYRSVVLLGGVDIHADELTYSSEPTIIDGGGTNRCVTMRPTSFNFTDNIIYSYDVIQNCTLVNGNAADGGGILEGNAYGCLITGNQASNGGGAYNSVLSECIVSNNTAAVGGGTYGGTNAVCLITSNNADIAPSRGGGTHESLNQISVIVRNSATLGGGTYGGENFNCTIVTNTALLGGGTYEGASYNTIVWGNEAPSGANYFFSGFSYCCTEPLADGEGNISADPAFFDAEHDDYSMWYYSPCFLAGSPEYVEHYSISGYDGFYLKTGRQAASMGSYGKFHVLPGDRYVRMDGDDNADGRSWATAKATIQNAVDSMDDNHTVWVSNGVYSAFTAYYTLNNSSRNREIRIKSLNGPGVTIIDGGGTSRCVRLGHTLPDNTWLEGFTLENGTTENEIPDNVQDVHDFGGGVLHGVVSNCVIRNCFAVRGGGSAIAMLYDCVVTNNTALEKGGGTYWGYTYWTLIAYNHSEDTGGGSASTANSCLIVYNTAAKFGGGAGGGGNLYNCTIYGNSAGVEAGGIQNTGLYNDNCIVLGNSAPENPNFIPNKTLLRYSCTWPEVLEPSKSEYYTNTIWVSELPFVDVANWNFYLKEGSPCIGTGLVRETGVYGVSRCDYAGNPRNTDGKVNMGALEFYVAKQRELFHRFTSIADAHTGMPVLGWDENVHEYFGGSFVEHVIYARCALDSDCGWKQIRAGRTEGGGVPAGAGLGSAATCSTCIHSVHCESCPTPMPFRFFKKSIIVEE